MTRVLSVDTSTWWCGLALAELDAATGRPGTVAELGLQVQRSHADRLLASADWLLQRAGWSKSSLDGFVATRGPGSFTGIRVGLGTIGGLALAADRPCATVTTFEALAEAHGPADRERVTLIGAGRGEVYGASFDADSSPPQPVGEPWLRAEGRLPDSCAGECVLIFAPGCEAIAARTSQVRGGLRVAAVPRGVAAAAARVALSRGFPRGGACGPLSPLYIRPPDAVLNRR